MYSYSAIVADVGFIWTVTPGILAGTGNTYLSAFTGYLVYLIWVDPMGNRTQKQMTVAGGGGSASYSTVAGDFVNQGEHTFQVLAQSPLSGGPSFSSIPWVENVGPAL